jgi:hypothetical protein
VNVRTDEQAMAKFRVTFEARVEITGEIEAVDVNEATLQAEEGLLDKVRSYVLLDRPVIVSVSEPMALVVSSESGPKRVN